MAEKAKKIISLREFLLLDAETVCESSVQVKVIQPLPSEEYYDSRKKKKGVITKAKIADQSGCGVLLVYKEEIADMVKENKGLQLRRSKKGQYNHMIVQDTTHVLRIKAPNVTDEIIQEAQKLVETPNTEIAEILKSPATKKKKFNVENARITKDSAIRRNEDSGACWRDINIEDKSGEISVRLWGETSKSPIKCGQKIALKGVLFDNWKGTNRLNVNNMNEITTNNESSQFKVIIEGIKKIEDNYFIISAASADDNYELKLSIKMIGDYLKQEKATKEEIEELFLDKISEELSVVVTVFEDLVMEIKNDDK